MVVVGYIWNCVIFFQSNLKIANYRRFLGVVVSILILVLSAFARPVIIGGKTIPESRISRDAVGQVIALNLRGMGLDGYYTLRCIRPFASSIQAIDISDNELTRIDLSPLSDALNLYSLNLSNNDLKEIDLSPLAGLERFSLLMASSNRISEIDLAPLSLCPRMKILNIQDNRIHTIDLEPLCCCDSLRAIWLYNNQLSDISVDALSRIKSLREARLYKNKLLDECIERLQEFASTNPSIELLYK